MKWAEKLSTSDPNNIDSRRQTGASIRPPKILTIVHTCSPATGYVRLALEQLGYTLDVRCPRSGSPLPEHLDDHTGVIVFGGQMSANDNEDFIRQELEWLKIPLEAEKPFLGICLGGQLLAKHLGADVKPDPKGSVEVGYFPVEPVSACAKKMQMPNCVFQWHSEGFSLPSGSTLVCEGLGAFENQAFRYGDNAYGLQFHPEVTISILLGWVEKMTDDLNLNGAQSKEDFLDKHISEACNVRAWLKTFLAAWLDHDAVASSSMQPLAHAQMK